MKLIADRYENIKAGLMLDSDAVNRYGDLVDLSIGDTDFTTDERIIDAAMRDARAGHTRYGFPQGDPELIDAIRTAWREDFGQEIPHDNVFITASSCLGMAEVLMTMLNPGDEVIVLGPYFAIYREQIQLAGGVCVEVPSYEEEGYALVKERLLNALSPRTRAVILNNPCNPTGMAYSRADLNVLSAVAQERDLVLIADEIYTKYVFEGEFIPLRTLPGLEGRVITLNSFSKNFMMTGWRVGCVIAPAAFCRALQQLNGSMIYTAPSVSQRAAIEALRLREDVARRYITRYRDRLLYAADRVERIPWMTLSRPKGTFYLFPGITKTGLDSAGFCKAALEQAHVLMSPGSAFGKSGAGHVRIAVTQPMEKLQAAFDRLEAMRL
ncbi:MAG: aminotransferase class I/II-fold pyridoxal phosphate-dependent enzyme [Clostridia bacterium]|nr:aminotransferase class I/II-fold pyridoxal phosphate-dependent enzyme [Clostridia bacterium]